MKITFTLLFSGLYFLGISQTTGISASKLVVINSETVAANSIEFEPSFEFSVSAKDSLQTSSDFGFRFTYGLNSKTEIGLSVPVNLNSVNWGLKYNAFTYNQLSAAFIFGIQNSLTDNKLRQENYSNFFNCYSGGIAATYSLNKKTSIDFTSQIQNKFHFTHQDFLLFFNSEIGFFVAKGLQLVTGFQYTDNPLNDEINNEFTLNTGITVETAENFILVLNFPYQFKTKNKPCSIGFSLALTILID